MSRMVVQYCVLSFVCLALCCGQSLKAQTVGPKAEDLAKSREKGINFLKSSQASGGYWTSPDVPGITALVAYSLMLSGVPATDPVVDKALAQLLKNSQPDGGIYSPKGQNGNYETSLCLLALHQADAAKYKDVIAKAEGYLRRVQWGHDGKVEASDIKYGGAGYGRTGDRPDLSNTYYFLEALEAAGAKKDDPAVQKAVLFLSRCQNLETEHNTTKFSSLINDGGFYYTPAGGGNSAAGNSPNGGLRSYGSMTYAGLKSMIFAGLTPEDPRVKAASEWITKFYTVEENPGMGQQGVLYYYHMFAKALSTMDQDLVKDAQGRSHDWRRELAEQLFSRQQENGAWINKTDRWFEGNPDLATSFALLSLKYCEPKAAKSK